MSLPWAATQAMAAWATLTFFASAILRSASTSSRLRSMFCAWKRGLAAR